MLALSAEALLEVSFRDESRIVNVEMMEGECQVGLSDGLSAVDSDSKELGVVDLAIVVEIDSFEDLIDLLLRHVQLTEGSPNLAQLKCARVVFVKCAEGISQDSKVESARIDLIHKEGECLDLEGLGLTEILDTSQDLQLLRIEKCGVVSGVVLLDIVRGEPWVLKALLSRDPLSGVLSKHLAYKVLG